MLLAIPFLQNKDYKKDIPIGVLLLSAILILVYFTLQANDKLYHKEAIEYYFKSGLYKYELPAYLTFEQNHNVNALLLSSLSNKKLYWQARSNYEFQLALDQDQIITQNSPNYWDWEPLHRHYDNLLSLDTIEQLGYKTATPKVETAVISLFLHGGFIHLIGNVIFLILVGRFVEHVLGLMLTIVMFFVCGLGGILCYQIAVGPSLVPLVGASGAVAGMMGLFTVLYSHQKLSFFVNIFFYSTIVTWNAIYFLPIWVGWELGQSFLYPGSETAFYAHLGGLSIGAISGLILKRINPKFIPIIPVSQKENTYEKDFNEAMNAIIMLDYPKAKKILVELNKTYPESHAVLFQLFNVSKVDPESSLYNEVITKILSIKIPSAEELGTIKTVLLHYLEWGVAVNYNIIFLQIKKFRLANLLDDAIYILKKCVEALKEQPGIIPLYNIAQEHLLLTQALLKVGEIEKAENLLQWFDANVPKIKEVGESMSYIKKIYDQNR